MPLRRAVPRVMQARGPNDGERCGGGGGGFGVPGSQTRRRHGQGTDPCLSPLPMADWSRSLLLLFLFPRLFDLLPHKVVL